MADTKFGVVLADPPWKFMVWGRRGESKSASAHYPTQPLVDVIHARPFGVPVSELCADDCALFLWVPFPHIFDVEKVANFWGFDYSGLAWCWIKQNPATQKFAFGLGYGTRKNLEPCLLARRGSPKVLNKSVRDFIIAPRREHSRKPDEQYERIESMFAGPYLELFARQERLGWTAWGDEVDKFNKGESDQ